MTTSEERTFSRNLQDKPCYLLRLPAELRLEIYETVFSTTCLCGKDVVADRTKLDPSLLYTSGEIFDEALPAFKSQLTSVHDRALDDNKLALKIMRLLSEHVEKTFVQGHESSTTLAEYDTLWNKTAERPDAALAVLDRVIEQRERLLRFAQARSEGADKRLSAQETLGASEDGELQRSCRDR